MAGITTHQDVQKHIAQYGQFVFAKLTSTASGNAGKPTNANAPSLWFDNSSSEPGTLNGVGGEDNSGTTGHWYPQSSEQMLEMLHLLSESQSGPLCLSWLYKLGTVDCSATGDKFTSSFTQPLTRSVMGTSQAINVNPVGYVTTVMTGVTTYILKTAAGGTGYVNQDGTNVVGTVSTSLGSAAATRTQWFMPLEGSDIAVQKIAAVDITASGGGAGAFTVFGMEPLGFVTSGDSTRMGVVDNAFGTLGMMDMKPASPTAGTVVAYLVLSAYSFLGSGSGFIGWSSFPNV